MRSVLCSLLLLLSLGTARAGAPSEPRIMFDDFNYSSHDAMTRNSWIIRTELGWPGIPGSRWGRESISFLDDPALKGNRLVRMTSVTRGSDDTRQSQFCHERKYLEGTYAARVRFTDAPVAGPDGDQVVQTFYMISPLKEPMDLDYSELDWEYLPNGGWGNKGPTLYATTWETFHPEPKWKADNESKKVLESFAGWHTVLLHVSDDRVRYYLDGKLFADHGGRFYPEVPMAIDFNLWFIRNGLIAGSERREYVQDVDWVFHQAGTLLTPDQVSKQVDTFRRRRVRFTDTVPDAVPPLVSPCNF